MAVPFLREATMPCTEQQMEALTSCLSKPEAFGPVNAWGPEVFLEIGTLAGTVENHILKLGRGYHSSLATIENIPEAGKVVQNFSGGVIIRHSNHQTTAANH